MCPGTLPDIVKRHLVVILTCRCLVCPSLVTPRAVACEAPLSMKFPSREYWRRDFPSSPVIKTVCSQCRDMDLIPGRIYIKRHLLLGGKAMTNLDSILKIRDITLPTKAHIVKAMVFLVVVCGCESWTMKKAEC